MWRGENEYHYIEYQASHHHENYFKEEYEELLRRFEIRYDERYIFEPLI